MRHHSDLVCYIGMGFGLLVASIGFARLIYLVIGLL